MNGNTLLLSLLALLIGIVAGMRAMTAPAAGSWGAVIGTLGGRAFRARLASAFGNDHSAALVEDAIAIGAAILAVLAPR
jgi:uncharacterized membrane protein